MEAAEGLIANGNCPEIVAKDGKIQNSSTAVKVEYNDECNFESAEASPWIFLAIGSVHFLSSACISLQAPFYPKEAEAKGASATEYGLVFGIFEFVACISSPILGKYMNTVGVKKMLCLGMVLAAVATICFGLLHYAHDHFTFISLSFILRITESVGATAALVSAFSITAAVYPEAFATKFAALETFYGTGYIAGPLVGGVIYSYLGYVAPFVIMGTLMIAGTLYIFLVLPPITPSSAEEVKMTEILQVPSVFLDSICIFSTAITMGFLAATLEPHIRELELSKEWLMFIISGGTYAVLAPIVGRLCDTWTGEKQLRMLKRILSLGAVCIIICYILVGPLPLLKWPKSVTLCVLGLLAHGLGVAFLMTPTFIDSICSSVAAGYPNDISTYSVISGIWSSSFALGAFIGPSMAGYLFDKVGFQRGSAYFVIPLHALLFVVITAFVSFEKKMGSKKVIAEAKPRDHSDSHVTPDKIANDAENRKLLTEDNADHLKTDDKISTT